MDSAMLVSGSLPMSSAETASTMLVDPLGFDGVLDADADAGDEDVPSSAGCSARPPAGPPRARRQQGEAEEPAKVREFKIFAARSVRVAMLSFPP